MSFLFFETINNKKEYEYKLQRFKVVNCDLNEIFFTDFDGKEYKIDYTDFYYSVMADGDRNEYRFKFSGSKIFLYIDSWWCKKERIREIEKDINLKIINFLRKNNLWED